MEMKKKLIGVLSVMTAAALFAGCGQDKTETGVGKYVDPGEYKGIEINVSPLDQETLEMNAAQYYFSMVPVSEQITDRPVERLDLANIDFMGKKDGVAFEGGTSQGYDLLIGSGSFIAGFEEGLIGVKPGETVDLDLRFPDGYGNADLAGQDVVFTVTVNHISAMQDERIADLGIENVSNIEQFLQYLKEEDYRDKAQSAVLQKVMEQAVFEELPAERLEENKKLYENVLTQMAQAYGVDAKTYLSQYGMEYSSTIAQYAEEYTRQQLLFEAIADREDLHLSDEKFAARAEEYARSINMTVDELLTDDEAKKDLRNSFLYDDVLNFLVDNATNTAKE